MANIFDPLGRSSQLAGSMTGYGPSAGGLESPQTDSMGSQNVPMPQAPQMGPTQSSNQSQGQGQEPPETPQEQMLKEILGIMRKRRKIVGLSQGLGQTGMNLGV